MMAMSRENLFPDEIVVEILSRLPANSLLRFRCVSRWWNNIIIDPHFIQKHVNTSRRRATRGYLLVQQESTHWGRTITSSGFFSFFYDETLVEHNKLEFPPETPIDFVEFFGYSNGLICFSYPVKTRRRFASASYEPEIRTLYLWNPAIRRYKALPHSLLDGENRSPDCCLGYVPHSNDYRVLKMGKQFNATVTELYSLSTNSWKRIQDISCRSYLGCEENVVNDNGIVHWVPWMKEDNGFIVTFDMGNETFGEMKLPADVAFDGSAFPSLLLLGGCVCLCLERNYGDDELWVMKEYGVPESWTKCFIFNDFGCSPRPRPRPRPRGFLKNGETVLKIEIEQGTALVSYDPTSQQLVNLPIILEQDKFGQTREAVLVTSYMETLVLL